MMQFSSNFRKRCLGNPYLTVWSLSSGTQICIHYNLKYAALEKMSKTSQIQWIPLNCILHLSSKYNAINRICL